MMLKNECVLDFIFKKFINNKFTFIIHNYTQPKLILLIFI